MAGNPIKYSEIFNLDDPNIIKDLISGLKSVNQQYDKFAASVQKQSEVMSESLKKSAEDIKNFTKQVSASRAEDREAIMALAAATETLRQRQNTQASATAASTRVTQFAKDSVNALRQQIKDLTAEYNTLSKSETVEAEKMEKLAADVSMLKGVMNDLTGALKAQKQVTDFATGSYKALEEETKRLTKSLKEMPDGFAATNKEGQALIKTIAENNKKLLEFDKAIGINNRNVGNYASGFAGLNNSIQQVLRELPSLAISANTFFLAISNNLPILVDNIQAVTRANKEAATAIQAMAVAEREAATASALAAGASQKAAEEVGSLAQQVFLANNEVKKGPSLFAILGKSLFSLNSLITIGITLLTIYGGKIVQAFSEWIRNASAAQRVTDDFNQAIRDSNKALGDEIAQLKASQLQLMDTTKTMHDLYDVKTKLAKDYPEYLGFLDRERMSTEQINEAVQNQIKYLKDKQKLNAAQEALSKAVEAEAKAEQELNEILNGKISIFKGATGAISDLRAAQDQVAAATKRYTDVQNGDIETRKKQIVAIEHEISLQELGIRLDENAISHNEGNRKDLQNDISLRYKNIAALREQITAIQELIGVRVKMRDDNFNAQVKKDALTQLEYNKISADTRVKLAKSGTKEMQAAVEAQALAEYNIEKDKLDKIYRDQKTIRERDFRDNKDYQLKLAALQADMQNKIAKDQGKKGAASSRTVDFTAEFTRAQQDQTRLMGEELAKRAELSAMVNKDIAEDDKNSLNVRLQAYEEFSDYMIQAASYRLEGEVNAEQEKLSTISQIEKRIGKSAEDLTQKQLEELVKRRRISNEEAQLLMSKETVILKQKNIRTQYEYDITKIVQDNARFRREAIEQEGEEAVNYIIDSQDKVTQYYRLQYAQQIVDLKDRYDKGLINAKQYKAAMDEINSQIALSSAKDNLQNVKDGIDALSSQGIDVAPLLDIYDKLANDIVDLDAKAQAKMTENRTKNIKKLAGQVAEALQLVQQIGTGLFDISRQQSQDKLTELQEQHDEEIRLAGNSAAAKERIDAKYRQLEAQEKTKQAQRDKNEALFNIAIQTAIGAAKAVAESPLTFGQPFLSFVIAQGLIQAALVAAKPLPKYYKGRQGGPAEYALVGEKGQEAVQSASGDIRMVGKSGPEVVHLDAGDRVHTAESEISRTYANLLKGTEKSSVANSTRSAYIDTINDIKLARSKHDNDMAAAAAVSLSKSLSPATLTRAFGDAVKGISVQESYWDEQGYSKYQRKKNERVKLANSRNSLRGARK